MSAEVKGVGYSGPLPLWRAPRFAWATSLALLLITFALSLYSLLNRHQLYAAPEVYSSFMPNDLVNLVLGVPFLGLAMLLFRAKKFAGLMLWPGALFFLLYQYTPYLVAVRDTLLWYVWAVQVVLALLSLIGLLVSVNGLDIRERLSDRVRIRLSGWVLTLLGLLILGRQATLLGVALYQGDEIEWLEAAVWVADLAVAVPLLLVSGIGLLRRGVAGFVLAGGMLLAYLLLTIAVIGVLYYQSRYEGSFLNRVDMGVLGAMALVCLWPTIGFLNGAVRSS